MSQNLTKLALDDDQDLRSKMLRRVVDKFAEKLTDTSYDLLDLLNYPETDKFAREYRALVIKTSNELANIRTRERAENK